MKSRLAFVISVVVAAVSAPVVLTGVAVAEPTAPTREFVACVWERPRPLATIDCGRPFERTGNVAFAQCWRSRPTGAAVMRRVDGEWKRTSIAVRITGDAPACPGTFPWKSVAIIPATSKMVGSRDLLRLYVPARDGKPASQVQFGLCVMSERSVDPCAA